MEKQNGTCGLPYYNEFESRYNEFKSRYNEFKSRYYDFVIKNFFFTHGPNRASYIDDILLPKIYLLVHFYEMSE